MNRGELGYRLLWNDIFREMATHNGKPVTLVTSAATDFNYTRHFGEVDFTQDAINMIAKIAVHKDTPLLQTSPGQQINEVGLINEPEARDVEWFFKLDQQYFKVTDLDVFSTSFKPLYETHFSDVKGKSLNERGSLFDKLPRQARLAAMENQIKTSLEKGEDMGVRPVEFSELVRSGNADL